MKPNRTGGNPARGAVAAFTAVVLSGSLAPGAPAVGPAPARSLAAGVDAYLKPYVEGGNFTGVVMMHWSSGADSILAPVGSDEFLDRSFWARVRFERDREGPVARLVWIYDGHEYPAAREREAS